MSLRKQICGVILDSEIRYNRPECYAEASGQILSLIIERVKGIDTKVADHSVSMWCPHCGEEFGIEMEVELARNEAIQAMIKEVSNEPTN